MQFGANNPSSHRRSRKLGTAKGQMKQFFTVLCSATKKVKYPFCSHLEQTMKLSPQNPSLGWFSSAWAVLRFTMDKVELSWLPACLLAMSGLLKF